MKHLLALLTIPFFVVGNTFSHTHGSDDTTSSHQTQRPHVHFGFFHHANCEHHHGHDGNCGESCPEHPIEHDSDAVYLSGGQFFLPATIGFPDQGPLDCIGFINVNHSFGEWNCQPGRVGHETPNRAGPSLFVLHAALRL